MGWTRWVCSSGALLLACGPTVGDDGGDATSSSTASASASASGTGPDPTAGPGSGSDPTTSTTTSQDDATTVDTGASFTDVGALPDSCDLFSDECPKGYKCMPWANDGGSWNATKCSPIAPDPRGVGEPCTVEGSAVSGIDDCEAHAMCFDVDPDTNVGECIAFCYGNESDAFCTDPCSSCTVSADGPLALCLPTCNPIGPDGCDDGQVCIPVGDTFACAVQAQGGGVGTVGAPCEFSNVCDPGLFCADASQLPSCDGAVGCCAAFCDLDAEDPCDAIMPGTVCTPWYADGEAPPDSCVGGAVGACASP